MKHILMPALFACAMAASADQWTWDFDGNLNARGEAASPLEPFGTFAFENSDINGDDAAVVRFDGGSGPDTDARFRVLNPAGPNGGGDFTNQFTLIMDVLLPAETWTSLLQTNTGNGNDGDWFVNPDGGLGISGDYADDDNPLRLAFNQWHRLVLVIDTSTPPGDDITYRSYVDGALQNVVQNPSGWGPDGRFTLEGVFHLFADNNGETQPEAWINSFQIRDYAMSAAEVADLGGPSATGIPGDPPGPELHLGPYVQNVATTSAWICWETTHGDESRVEYGTTPDLDQTATGFAIETQPPARVHHVRLGELSPDTTYYYRTITAEVISEVRHFRTQPLASTESSFRFAVISDTQRDDANTDKFEEIVNAGIISFVHDNYGADLAEQLAFILLAGDLVSTGSIYNEWKHDFFDEAQNLFQHVPLYPVYGNHEQDTDFFLKYMNLPDNGSPGFHEHWYYFDYGNVRIIGLDTNGAYRIQEQLDWLDNTLAAAAANPYIDFVFAQFHHPALSELWTPGELDYSRQIVERLEQFTGESGKPSAHFFGHTHGYSRGQSLYHQHLWVNVASGEGNIDYWGEFSNADYPQFQRTFPDWGFVVVEVEAGDNPAFTLRRISRGNEIAPTDNVENDTVTIRTNNQSPATPIIAFPSSNTPPLNPDGFTAAFDSYHDPDNDPHLETHFQVSATPGEYDDPAGEVWLRGENLYSPPDASGPNNGYYSVDTAADVDLTRASVTTLEPETTYYCRVRYRDDGLVWSAWSPEVTFTTGVSAFGPNLLLNPGAEEGTAHWTITDPPLEAVTSGQCSIDFPAHGGDYLFCAGGVCENEDAYAEAHQLVDVSEFGNAIDAGHLQTRYGGYLRDWSGSDRPEVWVTFLDGDGESIAEAEQIGSNTPVWTRVANVVAIPPQTRSIRFHLSGSRNAGTDNDSYLDDLFLRVGTVFTPGDTNCDSNINFDDIAYFVAALSGEQAWAAYYADQHGGGAPPCAWLNADCNGDGGVDFDDVAAFIGLLSGA